MLQVIRQFWWIGIWGIVNTLIFKYMNSFKKKLIAYGGITLLSLIILKAPNDLNFTTI